MKVVDDLFVFVCVCTCVGEGEEEQQLTDAMTAESVEQSENQQVLSSFSSLLL